MDSQTDGGPSTYFVIDVEILEQHRGQGLGRLTMQAGEEFVRQQGGSALELNVLWINEVARNLYLSLGYNFTSAHMRKALEALFAFNLFKDFT